MKGKPKTLTPKLRFPEFRDGPGWETCALEHIAERITTRNYDGTHSRVLTNSAERGVLDQRDYFDREIASAGRIDTYYVVERGDYVYNPRTSAIAPLGPISRNNLGTGVMSPLYTVFRFTDDHTDFYEHYFKSAAWYSYLRSISSIGARYDRMSITSSAFMQMPVPMPNPAEQRKIADCLTSLDKWIAAEERKLEALRTHKKGLMRQLFPREGETRPRLRFPEFRNGPKWEDKKLDDLAQRGSGHTPNKGNPEYYNGGIKWVSLADSRRLDRGLISETEIEISEQGIENSSAVLHPEGSVILSRDAGVGKSAVLACQMAVSQHFIVWTCDPCKLSNWFLYHLLQKIKPLFERIATGSTIKTIGLPFFSGMRVTVPSLQEQKRIAACLSSLDALVAAQSRKLDGLRAHKKGLMQQVFPSPEGF